MSFLINFVKYIVFYFLQVTTVNRALAFLVFSCNIDSSLLTSFLLLEPTFSLDSFLLGHGSFQVTFLVGKSSSINMILLWHEQK